MRNIPLFDSGQHKFVLLNESESGEEEGVPSNQYLVQHDGGGVLLDPGGFGVMPRVLAEMLHYVGPDRVKAIVLSHQDPDVLGGIATWLELTEAQIYVSHIWTRFLPHCGIKSLERFVGVPDHGMRCQIAPGFALELVPAHFLHSQGNLNAYDPVSKILFTGDIGAAVLHQANEDPVVDDFAAHVPYIEGFHRRYMSSNRAARLWVEAVSKLDIHMLAPQHGPIYRGQAVKDFLAWFRDLECGADLLTGNGVFREPVLR